MLKHYAIAAAGAAMLGVIGLPAHAADAGDPGRHVNLKGGGVALHGYDPVAYFDRKAAVKGDPRFSASYQGVRYQFADAADQHKFEGAPAHYVPVYGGFCAYGVAQGFKVDVDPEAFTVVDDRLYLNVSKAIRAKWVKDTSGYIRKADTNWPAVKDKKSGVLGGLFS